MTLAQLVRIGSVALLVGGILGLLGGLVTPNSDDPIRDLANPLFLLGNWAGLVGSLLTVLGLPAAYSRLAGGQGVLALIGFIGLMLAAMLFGVFLPTFSLLVVPWVAAFSLAQGALGQGPPGFMTYFIVAGVIALIGAILFGLALIRSEVFANWPGYVLILAGIVNLVTGLGPSLPGILSNLGGDLFYVALLGIGYELWRHADSAAAAPTSG